MKKLAIPRKFLLVCAAGLISAGCASSITTDPASDSPGLFELAGEPVNHIRFSKFLEWWPVDRDWLLLRFTHQKYYLVKPMDPCFANLREAGNMTLAKSTPNRLDLNDRLRLDGRECRIAEILPVDVQSHVEARQALAQTQRSGET